MAEQANEPVVLVEHDPRWSSMYCAELQRIAPAIGAAALRCEHIGSTAVSGLRAKPIIDILVGVASLTHADACIDPLTALDYEYVKRFETRLPRRRFFRRRVNGATTFQVHMVELDGDLWREHLLFRNALQTYPDLRERYLALKEELAERFRDQRESYADAKGEFVREALRIAESRGLKA
ncbi:MAG: GrpB family protein [Phycisphaerales bacterium]|nr:GrpB family protein [Phycisphaerales bacterium]